MAQKGHTARGLDPTQTKMPDAMYDQLIVALKRSHPGDVITLAHACGSIGG